MLSDAKKVNKYCNKGQVKIMVSSYSDRIDRYWSRSDCNSGLCRYHLGVLTKFGALIPGLRAGRFDMIAATMYITPPYRKQVQFQTQLFHSRA
jgi:Bacterial extracellular solute-binding proteins, family 3